MKFLKQEVIIALLIIGIIGSIIILDKQKLTVLVK